MSIDTASRPQSAQTVKRYACHPLSPLSSTEIKKTVEVVRGLWPTETRLQFKVVTLEEPEKAQMIPYLDAERSRTRLPHIERKGFVCYCIRNTVGWHLRHNV